jgi:hypothetical protein
VTVCVTEDEYFEALDSAMDILNYRLPTSARPMGEEALGAVLTWAWDSVPTKPDTLDGLLCCDLKLRDLALRIIVGRCCHGRPIAHPRRDEIERFYNWRIRENCTDETG